MKMMKIETLWKELENDKSFIAGLLYKRVSSRIIPDIYAAIKSPEKLRCIAVQLNIASNLDMKRKDKFQDIKIETYIDDKYPDKKFLIIVLLNNQYMDIFAILCEDLINHVERINDDTQLIKELFVRLEKWQALFEQLGQQGLSPEAQRGLYGEIYFLRKLLDYSTDYISCIDSWKGPEKASQDFQYSKWALEVKTTHGKKHQKIFIANELQLDTNVIPEIYLYHLSIDLRDNSGETLNSAVDSVLTILESNYSASNGFKLKLLEVGYFDLHRHIYSDTGYSIRQERIFHVAEDFPRITESQIPNGVGDVKYSIVLADEVPWRISEKKIIQKNKAG